MIELLMGIVFLGMSGLFSVVTIMDGEFGVFLFLTPFWLAGGWLLYTGIKKVLTNIKTNKLGMDTYGLVVDFTETGTYVNGYPVWCAHVLVFVGNRVQRFREEVGTDPRFDVGDFVRVKHYENDINVEERESMYSIPSHIREMLELAAPVAILKHDVNINNAPQKYKDFVVTEDSVIIDGVSYPRQDKKEQIHV